MAEKREQRTPGFLHWRAYKKCPKMFGLNQQGNCECCEYAEPLVDVGGRSLSDLFGNLDRMLKEREKFERKYPDRKNKPYERRAVKDCKGNPIPFNK